MGLVLLSQLIFDGEAIVQNGYELETLINHINH
jgi:hypothetical protein